MSEVMTRDGPIDEAAVQAEFERRICLRNAESVIEWFGQTDTMPNAANIEYMMRMSDRIQEVYDIKGGDKPSPETKFFNMYIVFKGVSDTKPYDLVDDYFCPRKLTQKFIYDPD